LKEEEKDMFAPTLQTNFDSNILAPTLQVNFDKKKEKEEDSAFTL